MELPGRRGLRLRRSCQQVSEGSVYSRAYTAKERFTSTYCICDNATTAALFGRQLFGVTAGKARVLDRRRRGAVY